MAAERVHRTVHETEVAAPAGVVYGLIADPVQWPLYFPPNVYVERLEFDGVHERLRMWATANGRVKSWTSRRVLDAAARRIEFRQEVPAAPLAAMTGTWIVEPLGAERSRLVLLHDFSVAGDRAEDVEWVERATDTNSRAELGNLARLGERWGRLDDLVMSFEDTVRVDAPPELVYAFLERAERWPELLPHVSRLELAEPEELPGVQVMAMDTLTADGSAHTTESVRVCFPAAGRIVYKQTRTPALMSAHTGAWTVTGGAYGSTVTSRHGVVLREEAVAGVLGASADLAAARRYVREALGRNSTATMTYAKQYAESALAR
ncbi:aromatase/cyclase [Streptomyces vinaceus]|uniref:aromatase/cyclase n=1 Tax=Streptomyces vinaceus TaxID=1960 RepID=UPI000C1871ED|nr:aromatase/cyclase [Streptomyces vinaceus]GHE43027.1 actinorhodin polyketide synthase bifunctional cyclase/dehydratase [Streptomyces vinaceus]